MIFLTKNCCYLILIAVFLLSTLVFKVFLLFNNLNYYGFRYKILFKLIIENQRIKFGFANLDFI